MVLLAKILGGEMVSTVQLQQLKNFLEGFDVDTVYGMEAQQ
jgi:hypothetical protein